MAESDSESRFDEMERDNLQKVISEVEAAQAASKADKKPMLDHFLQNARGRVAVLDKRIKESKAENESRQQAAVAVAALAAKETALSSSEKETYSGFLAKGFFTKNDFGSLEKFYAQTWNRLSESGKAEMSHRIWEGIRRDEYKFTDLPKVVQEKEAERAYYVLKKREAGVGNASQIPDADREEFIRAYESGHRDEACRILDRKSFRENMALNVPSTEKNDTAIAHARAIESASVEKRASAGPVEDTAKPRPTSGGKAELDLSALNLDGVRMADAPDKVRVADLPAETVATAKGGQLLRNG